MNLYLFLGVNRYLLVEVVDVAEVLEAEDAWTVPMVIPIFYTTWTKVASDQVQLSGPLDLPLDLFQLHLATGKIYGKALQNFMHMIR